MKRLFFPFLAFLLFSYQPIVAQNPEPVYSPNDGPKFNEPGYANFSEWIQSHLVYPESARKNKMEGIVKVKFVVEKDGSVSNAVATQALGFSISNGQSIVPDLEEEAVRVVLSSPSSWTPGRIPKDNNKLVAVRSEGQASVAFSLSGGAYEAPASSYDQKPVFHSDGYDDFAKWVHAHVVIPESAKNKGVSTTIPVRFTIDKNGEVINVFLTGSLSKDEELDREVIRVVRSSPKWQPGLKGGNPVKVASSVYVDIRTDGTIVNNISSRSYSSSETTTTTTRSNTSSNSDSQASPQQTHSSREVGKKLPSWAYEFKVQHDEPNFLDNLKTITRYWSCKLSDDGTCTVHTSSRGTRASQSFSGNYEGRWSINAAGDVISIRYGSGHIYVYLNHEQQRAVYCSWCN